MPNANLKFSISKAQLLNLGGENGDKEVAWALQVRASQAGNMAEDEY